MAIEGGCFCGAIRYRIANGDYPSVNCHCSMCRRTSAAPFVTWLVVPNERLEYTRGQPKVLESSDHGTRFFCADCGTPIMLDDKQGRIRVVVPNLMGYDAAALPATYHAFYDPASGAPAPDDGRPVHEALRPEFVWPEPS